MTYQPSDRPLPAIVVDHPTQMVGDDVLRRRLVAAYLIGGWLPESRYTGAGAVLPACERADDTAVDVPEGLAWECFHLRIQDGEPPALDGLTPAARGGGASAEGRLGLWWWWWWRRRLRDCF